MPVAYLWTRTVRCKNPSCGATVPLVRQTWLSKKSGGTKSSGRFVALKTVAKSGERKASFEVVEATSEKGIGFNPEVGSKAGNATCPF
jgi:putative DNA methylase